MRPVRLDVLDGSIIVQTLFPLELQLLYAGLVAVPEWDSGLLRRGVGGADDALELRHHVAREELVQRGFRDDVTRASPELAHEPADSRQVLRAGYGPALDGGAWGADAEARSCVLLLDEGVLEEHALALGLAFVLEAVLRPSGCLHIALLGHLARVLALQLLRARN